MDRNGAERGCNPPWPRQEKKSYRGFCWEQTWPNRRVGHNGFFTTALTGIEAVEEGADQEKKQDNPQEDARDAGAAGLGEAADSFFPCPENWEKAQPAPKITAATHSPAVVISAKPKTSNVCSNNSRSPWSRSEPPSAFTHNPISWGCQSAATSIA